MGMKLYDTTGPNPKKLRVYLAQKGLAIPAMGGRVTQSPEAAAYGRWYLDGTLAVLDAEIGPRPFVAGDRCTIADCTLFAALDFAEIFQIPFGISTPNVMRWYETFKRRPSAAA